MIVAGAKMPGIDWVFLIISEFTELSFCGPCGPC